MYGKGPTTRILRGQQRWPRFSTTCPCPGMILQVPFSKGSLFSFTSVSLQASTKNQHAFFGYKIIIWKTPQVVQRCSAQTCITLYRGHYMTNPNNANYTGNPSKIAIHCCIVIWWTLLKKHEMHYYMGNPSKLLYICIVLIPSKRVSFNDPCSILCWKPLL